MRFELNEDEQMLRDMVRDLVARDVREGAGHWDEAGALPAKLRAAVVELGLTGICAPEAADGAGLTPVALAVVLEELAVGSGSLAAWLGAQAGPATVALEAAGAPFHSTLKRAAAGRVRLAWLGALSGVGPQRLPAVVGAADADYLVGLSGQQVVCLPAAEAQITAGDTPALAFQAAARADVQLAVQPSWAAPVSAAAAQAIRDAAAVTQAAIAVGVARGALEATVPYTQDRKQFGRPISAFQAIQWMIADSATELDAARLLVHHAAEGEVSAAHALLLAGQMARVVTDRCIQMHGGYGYTQEYSVARCFRDAHHALLTAGPDGGRHAIAAAAIAG